MMAAHDNNLVIAGYEKTLFTQHIFAIIYAVLMQHNPLTGPMLTSPQVELLDIDLSAWKQNKWPKATLFPVTVLKKM